MLPLDDERWGTLAGGYRIPYDPRPALRRLATNFTDPQAWQELWGELHHQGDIGEAAYAAIPHLVVLAGVAPVRDWNLYALAATIETERHRRDNPPLSQYLAESYKQAWRRLLELALADLRSATDEYLIRSALTVAALGRGQVKLGAMLGHLDASEIDDFAENQLAWSQLYRADLESPHEA